MPIPIVLRTKITPPMQSSRLLPRSRVQQILEQSRLYRLSLLQAGAGYGKSTALAAFAAQSAPTAWYQVSEEDADPLVFLLHLCHATQTGLPGVQDLPIPFLETWEGVRGPLPSSGVIDQYINALSVGMNGELVLIIDDVNLALQSTEISHLLDRLVSRAPSRLHILLSGRPPLQLPSLSRLRLRGDVLFIDQKDLAFTPAEIAALFSHHYGYDLTNEEAETLYEASEGWAMALQVVWQSLRTGASGSVEDALRRPVSSLESLFDLLAQEVFQVQPPDVQDFLLASAALRELSPAALDALWLPPGSDAPVAGASAAMLAYLARQELFVVEQGEGRLRYHHIFHTFLRQRSSQESRQIWHRRAAAYYTARQEPEAAIYHLLEAGDLAQAASLMDVYGAQLLSAGRLDTLAATLDTLPPPILHAHPALLFYMGELTRLHSRFDEALGWYQQAEGVWRERSQHDGVARALRGQARIYLDTLDYARAEDLLEQSLRLSDGIETRESQARLYELLAENKLNAGRAGEAEALRTQAETLRSEGPSDAQLYFRVLLRTGRLEEARQALEQQAQAERREPVQTPRAHRETHLVLSLVYAFLGQAQASLQAAQEGTQRGIDLNSPFITAVGHMRQGHALSLLSIDDPGEARFHYRQTVELSQAISVPRLKVEAFWGLCRSFGYQGDLAQALQYAQEGIELAQQAGDEWVASLIRLATGASLSLAARYEAAEEWLSQAAAGFSECSDPHGLSASRLWLSLGFLRQKKDLRLEQLLPGTLSACRQFGYDLLFLKPTLLGPPDERTWAPLLVYARGQDWERSYASRLLAGLGLPEVEFHPGYRLDVQALGGFAASRGRKPIPSNGWRREKARQLFQLLLTYRQAPLDRDQILEYLWPGSDPTTAGRNFKVTLNTLYQVLEPERDPGSESAYVMREGSIYSLRHGADLHLDASEFIQRAARAEAAPVGSLEQGAALYQEAVDLYRGEYLPDARYETWAASEREHLAVLFLRLADRLAEIDLQLGRFEEAAALSSRLLAQDNCWERAYRHLMLAYHHMGDRGQAARTYQRCVQTLRDELDVAPDPQTEALYRRIVEGMA